MLTIILGTYMAAYDHIFDEFISTNIGNVGYQWQKKIQVWFDGV